MSPYELINTEMCANTNTVLKGALPTKNVKREGLLTRPHPPALGKKEHRPSERERSNSTENKSITGLRIRGQKSTALVTGLTGLSSGGGRWIFVVWTRDSPSLPGGEELCLHVCPLPQHTRVPSSKEVRAGTSRPVTQHQEGMLIIFLTQVSAFSYFTPLLSHKTRNCTLHSWLCSRNGLQHGGSPSVVCSVCAGQSHHPGWTLTRPLAEGSYLGLSLHDGRK